MVLATSRMSLSPASALRDSGAGSLAVLGGGAAEGLVHAIGARFLAARGKPVHGRFGAVGAMREAFLQGEPCDVMIATDRMLRELQQSGHLRVDGAAPVGAVATGVAVRHDDALPDVSSSEALRGALLGATEIFFPDPQRATAGIHFMAVVERLGITGALQSKLRPHPNGMTAMRALAQRAPAGAIGCTQITEIRASPGVILAGDLPPGCELHTLYSAGISANTAQEELAAGFIELLTGPETHALRRRLGFDDALPA